MTEEQMIEDLIQKLDAGITRGVSHVNVEVEDNLPEASTVKTIGCNACARTPLNSAAPSSSGNLKDFQ